MVYDNYCCCFWKVTNIYIYIWYVIFYYPSCLSSHPAPPNITIFPVPECRNDTTITLDSNGLHELVCEAEGNPVPVVQWFHDGRLEGEGLTAPSNEGSGRPFSARVVVNLTMPSITDGGLYSCVANSSLGSDVKRIRILVRGLLSEQGCLSYQCIISMHGATLFSFPTNLSLSLSLSLSVLAGVNVTNLGERTIHAGENLLLPCGFVNPRDVISLLWQRNDGAHLPRNSVTVLNGSLFVPSMSVRDGGLYECVLDTSNTRSTLQYGVLVVGM